MAQSTLMDSEDSLNAMRTSVGQGQVYSPITEDLVDLHEGKDAPSEHSPSSPAAKRLACERCHNQKLRCARQQDKLSCDRCLAAKATCAERVPRRLGRPHSTNSSISKTTAKKRRQRPVSHQAAPFVGQTTPAKGSRKTFNGQMADAAPKQEFTADVGAGILNQTPPSSVPERRSSPWTLTGLLSPSDCPSPFDWSVSDAEHTTADHLDEGCDALYPGHLIAGLGGLDPLVSNFGGVSDALLVNHSHMDDQAAIDTASPTTSLAQDPVERLTSLHLELYQCLNLFRSIEHQEIVRREPDNGNLAAAAALDWVERLFQAAEEFVEILKQGFGKDHDNRQDSSPASPLEDIVSPGPDSATSLMIISSYVRLLQIFDSFVSVLPAMLEAGCTTSANLLGVRIGSFCPTVDKRLGTAFIVQYVYHLLDSICVAVEASVGAQATHVPTLVDARNSEAKLRERISISLSMPRL